MLSRLYREPPTGPGAGAGGGVQTRIGLAVAVFSEVLQIVSEERVQG